MMRQFRIEAANLHWIDDPVNDPDDLCLHGDAVAYIGDRKLEYQECTVSAAALYLLKTLTENHIINQDNQMIPCCGHFLMANDDQTEVTIVGCPSSFSQKDSSEKQKLKDAAAVIFSLLKVRKCWIRNMSGSRLKPWITAGFLERRNGSQAGWKSPGTASVPPSSPVSHLRL